VCAFFHTVSMEQMWWNPLWPTRVSREADRPDLTVTESIRYTIWKRPIDEGIVFWVNIINESSSSGSFLAWLVKTKIALPWCCSFNFLLIFFCDYIGQGCARGLTSRDRGIRWRDRGVRQPGPRRGARASKARPRRVHRNIIFVWAC
jgi:hypothetical protein